MEHDHLIAMLNRLKLTAIRDQLDSLIDEAGRRELTIREALSLFCEREITRKDERRIEMGIGLGRFPFVRDLDGGKQVQNDFHQLIGVAQARGWSSQLQNEIGVVLSFERLWRQWIVGDNGFGIDIVPQVGASVGNIFTYGDAGALVLPDLGQVSSAGRAAESMLLAIPVA
jgi:hypothetical protein